MGKEVVYIAELDQDVDDVIAAEYLYKKGVLRTVVCDPVPKTVEGKNRQKILEQLGVKVSDRIPEETKYVFVGGRLTKLANYLVHHKIKYLIMNGGFVGANIVEKPLDKFKHKTEIRTFNFDCDVNATDRVLKSANIENIILIGKNVCHDPRNTMNGIWEKEAALLRKHHAKPTKLQHDMLACREGLIQIGLLKEPSYLNYKDVYPYHTGLRGNKTTWGSRLTPNTISRYRQVKAAINWK